MSDMEAFVERLVSASIVTLERQGEAGRRALASVLLHRLEGALAALLAAGQVSASFAGDVMGRVLRAVGAEHTTAAGDASRLDLTLLLGADASRSDAAASASAVGRCQALRGITLFDGGLSLLCLERTVEAFTVRYSLGADSPPVTWSALTSEGRALKGSMGSAYSRSAAMVRTFEFEAGLREGEVLRLTARRGDLAPESVEVRIE